MYLKQKGINLMIKVVFFIAVIFAAVSVQASPAKYTYQCLLHDNSEVLFDFVIQGQEAAIIDSEEKNSGTFDPSYGGELSDSFDRFVGSDADDIAKVLVQKEMRRGADHGQIRIWWHDSFSVDIFRCSLRN